MTYLSRILVVILTLVLCSSNAHAAPTDADREVAERLVAKGHARFDAEQYAAALELFKRAHEIMRAPTTGYDLARAHAALLQLVEAREVANEVIHIPLEPNEKPTYAGARADAKKAIKALDVRIPFLQLHVVGPPLTVVRVLIDGKTLSPEDVVKPYAANPGTHTVVVTAPDYHQIGRTVSLGESETASVDIVLKPMKAEPPPPKPDPTADSRKSAKRSTIVGFTGGGLLFAGLGTGIAAVMTYQTMVDAAAAYESANTSFCDATCLAFRKTYEDRQPILQTLTITTTALGVLGVGAVVFAILDKPKRKKPDVSFVVAPSLNGAVLQGVW